MVPVTKTHTYRTSGYGVEPCPRCDGPLLPQQVREVVAGEWRPRHQRCPQIAVCGLCEGTNHQEGMCLI